MPIDAAFASAWIKDQAEVSDEAARLWFTKGWDAAKAEPVPITSELDSGWSELEGASDNHGKVQISSDEVVSALRVIGVGAEGEAQFDLALRRLRRVLGL